MDYRRVIPCLDVKDGRLVNEAPLRVRYQGVSKPHRGRATDELYL